LPRRAEPWHSIAPLRAHLAHTTLGCEAQLEELRFAMHTAGMDTSGIAGYSNATTTPLGERHKTLPPILTKGNDRPHSHLVTPLRYRYWMQ